MPLLSCHDPCTTETHEDWIFFAGLCLPFLCNGRAKPPWHPTRDGFYFFIEGTIISA